jgi:hypothetical protein
MSYHLHVIAFFNSDDSRVFHVTNYILRCESTLLQILRFIIKSNTD